MRGRAERFGHFCRLPLIVRVSWTLLKQTLRGNPRCAGSHSRRNLPAPRQRRPAAARASAGPVASSATTQQSTANPPVAPCERSR